LTIDYEAIARRLWRGLPLLWQEEVPLFEAYSKAVAQELTEEGFELWITRVQARECPVAGSGCDKPRRSRFCDFHLAKWPLNARFSM
jgi:hypothetical protein